MEAQLKLGPRTQPEDGTAVHLSGCRTQNKAGRWKCRSFEVAMDPKRRPRMEAQLIFWTQNAASRSNHKSFKWVQDPERSRTMEVQII